jgi:thiol-disulfide isomerase/thioredoxin
MNYSIKLLQLSLISLLLLTVTACDTKKPVTANSTINKKAAEFSLPSVLDETEIKLSDYKGKLVLLNFWASWCPPCRAEIPGFINIQKKYKDKNFTIIGLALEDKNDALRYAKEISINYPIAYGIETVHDVASAYGNPNGGLPYTVLVSPDQKILSVFS